MWRIAALVLFLGSLQSMSVKSQKSEWSISDLGLSPVTDITGSLQGVAKSSRTHESYALNLRVQLTRLDTARVSGDKLVLTGGAGHADSVSIADLKSRRLIDWLYCYQPEQLSDRWVAYIEWYPRSAMNAANVVLLYDLSKSPAENRLNGAKLDIPAPETGAPVEVGAPVFPDVNARQESYREDLDHAARRVLAHTFVLIDNRLVFVATEGYDLTNSRDYLVMVDLSRGLKNEVSSTIEIPRNQLKKPGSHPSFIDVQKVERVGANTVRLYVPESEYGLSSFLVTLPQVTRATPKAVVPRQN
jgi:hypothetical protein